MNSTLTGFIACKGPVPALESLAHHSSPTAPNLSTSSDIIDLGAQLSPRVYGKLSSQHSINIKEVLIDVN